MIKTELSFNVCNQDKIMDEFTVYDTSFSINDTNYIIPLEINSIINEIKDYSKITGILFSYFQVSKNTILLQFIFDDIIILFERTKIIEFYDYISHNINSFIFLTPPIKDFFFKLLSQKEFSDSFSKMQSINSNYLIQNEIINSIILKSQYLTRLHNQKIIPISNNFYYNDFILINDFNCISNKVGLYYNIKNKLLYVLKSYEFEFRQKREIDFYQKVLNKFPFISKMNGTIKNGNQEYACIEYIEGKTLKNFILKNKNMIDFHIKLKIILEILLTVEFIHSNGIILRDLKWDNIIIDSKFNAIFIDFDLVKFYDDDYTLNTHDIGSDLFSSPEQKNSNYYSYETDIYSIGLLIHFIMTETQLETYDEDSKINYLDQKNCPKCPKEFEYLQNIYKGCLEFSPISRPSINSLIKKIAFNVMKKYKNSQIDNIINFIINEHFNFLSVYSKETNKTKLIDKFKLFNYFGVLLSLNENSDEDIFKAFQYLFIAAKNNYHKAQFILGVHYLVGQKLIPDANLAIHYLNLASDQNNINAQNLLGYTYLKGINSVNKDINKSIKYFTMSANNNNSDAQYFLGSIYYHEINNIPQSIHYLTLSSNQNNMKAKCLLGEIYYEGKFVPINTDKSIELLTTVAYNQDFFESRIYVTKNLIMLLHEKNIKARAQHFLGLNYLRNTHYDLNKAIHYLTLSADQNYSNAQYVLGLLYYQNKKINKSIDYLNRSAKQNNTEALLFLGYIYIFSNDIPRNVEKGIECLTLSANLFNSDAKCMLGEIYLKGIGVQKDIKKSIAFFKNAADNHNHKLSQYRLGTLYYDLGDINNAISYLKLASDSILNALYILGTIYYKLKNIDMAINYLKKASNLNHSKSQLLLGNIYFKGPLANKHESIYYFGLASKNNESEAFLRLSYIYLNDDINKSINYLKKAAYLNNSDAQFYLGYAYYCGDVIQHDMKKAIYYLELSANQKNANAQFVLGYLHYYNLKSSNKDKAINYLVLASNQKHPDANFQLGQIFYIGLHVKRDISRSIYYLTIASDLNNSDAQYTLGQIYYTGQYVPQDLKKAFHYFSLSLKQKNPYAQLIFGHFYHEGIYFQQNIQKSIYYYTLSANQNIPYANLHLGITYLTEVFQPKEAIKYLKNALSLNDTNASYIFALTFLYGTTGIPQDINESIKYFKISANQQNLDSTFILGVIYYVGYNIKKDIKKSISYWINCSSLNHSEAKNNLGVLYKNGEGVEKNIQNSIIYFTESIKFSKDSSMPRYNLAKIFYFGIDIEKNVSKSNEILEIVWNKKNDIINLFLFYIYYSNDDSETGKQKAKFFLDQINDMNIVMIVTSFILTGSTDQKFFYINRMGTFFYEYDMMYIMTEINNFQIFSDFMHTGFLKITYDYTSHENNIKSSQKNINKQFYEGFGLSIE